MDETSEISRQVINELEKLLQPIHEKLDLILEQTKQYHNNNMNDENVALPPQEARSAHPIDTMDVSQAFTLLSKLMPINHIPVLPEHEESFLGGSSHLPVFSSKISIRPFETRIEGRSIPHPGIQVQAVGTSKKEARNKAASLALVQLRDVQGLRWDV